MLELKYKQKRQKTKDAMKKAINDEINYYQKAVEVIEEYFPGEISILNSANSAIFTTVESLPEPILTADMGGWNGLERSAEILGKKIEKIRTDDSLINIENLKEYLENNHVGSFYITALGAYNIEQPLAEIYKLCYLHEVILIVDVSGVMGDSELTNTDYADIQIASTGTPKIVNIENGGFINNITSKVEFNKHLLKSFRADEITCAAIAEELPNAYDTLVKTRNATCYLRDILTYELKDNMDFKLVNPDSKCGINVIITTPSKSIAKKVAYNIRSNLKINKNKSIISTGPNYNRLKKASVCIEIKNIDLSSLTYDNMDKLAKIVVNSILRS